MVISYIDLWIDHEIVLPVAWSQNVIWVRYNFPSKPSVAKLHLTIHDRGVYRFGYKVSEFDPLLGFTVNVNGYDVYVQTPVNPVSEVIIDVTDKVLSGSNTFYVILWRSALNLVVSFYVIFTLRLETDVEATLQARSVAYTTGNLIVDITNLVWSISNLVIMITILYLAMGILPLIKELFKHEKT